ncbi:MAG: CRISPR-associated helicase/endonuclease Cas3 [Rhodothalassiaceae bacterium]|nr:MAG: CRISPR-associated helicase/endonuclease Cas3 [Rhodothalassiaceae bacterium]
MEPPIAAPWGKIARDEQSGCVEAWHPLVHHCLDVAAVMEALLTRTLLGARLAALAGVDALTPGWIRRLGWLAYLHDIGKLNPGFQARANGGGRSGHVAEGLALFRTGDLAETARGAMSADKMLCWFDNENERCAALGHLLVASIAHHGRPLPLDRLDSNAEWVWSLSAHHDELATQLCKYLEGGLTAIEPPLEGEPRLKIGPRFTHAFAGLVMLADWIGSDRRFFPYSKSLEEDRWPFARRQAVRALNEIGLLVDPWRRRCPERSWLAAIGIDTPRPMQEAVENLEIPDGPSVVLIESDTGSGKTEAAIAHFLHLFRRGLVDSLYFALPTRAAAVQMHGRVQGAMRRALGRDAPPVLLAVPGYLPAQPDAEGTGVRPLPDEGVLFSDNPHDAPGSRLWAAERPKRYLSATVAVGTVDQALLGALTVRHAHLRAAALSRSLLVVDEVHASDPYMCSLLHGLLDLLVCAGGHVLLMSATLGSSTRRVLLPEQADASPETEERRPYPLLTVWSRGGIARISCRGHAPDRHVAIELVPAIGEDAVDDVARRAVEAARQGARVLVIRNTVALAIATQLAVEGALGGDSGLLFRCNGVPAPHHGRFARGDRRRLDAAVEAVFGKRAAREAGCVLVATQTVEQSLDIDADLLITDICPMDVLIQRLGRLHRHARPRRPAGFETPRALVLVWPQRDLTPLLERPRGGFGIDRDGNPRAYPDMRVIEATWRLLEANPRLVLPAMSRRLVEGATRCERLDAIVEENAGPWAEHARRIVGIRAAQRAHAQLNCIGWGSWYGSTAFPDSCAIATRLGAADRVVVLPRGLASPFGGEDLDVLTVPHWLLKGGAAEAEPEVVADSPLRLRLGDVLLRYDRLGLRREEAERA